MSGSADGTCFKLNDFKIQQDSDPIGRGGFGKVWDAWHGKYGRVAIKIMELRVRNEDFEREIDTMSIASKEYSCAPMYGYISQQVGSMRFLGIVSMFMPCGSLYDLLHTHHIQLQTCLKYRMMYEISNAMMKLHCRSSDQRLLHCDLKPGNILLDGNMHVKLTDFGISRLSTVTDDITEPRSDCNNIKSWIYCAPEFFLTGSARTSKYDVYSFGIVMWEIATQQIPHAGFNRDQIRDRVTHHRVPSVSEMPRDETNPQSGETLRQLVTLSLSFEHDDRPTFTDLTEHLRPISTFPDNVIETAVTDAKQQLRARLNVDKLDSNRSNYTQVFQDRLTVGTISEPMAGPSGGNLIPLHSNPPPQPMHIEGDIDISTASEMYHDGVRVLTNQDCTKLGEDFHYTDGWEVFAARIGLPPPTVDNIKENNPRNAAMCKITMFREWRSRIARLNGGVVPVNRLVRLMVEHHVNMDCWEFLDPNHIILGEIRGGNP